MVSSVIHDNLSQSESTRLHKVSKVAVCNWLKKYNLKGDKSLKNKNHGRPSSTISNYSLDNAQ